MTDSNPIGIRRVLQTPSNSVGHPIIDASPVTTSLSEADAQWFAESFSRLGTNISRSLRGKDDQINLALIGLLAEGHILLEDVPGVGKTSLARAIAESIDGTWQRIQFTPDLLPSDVTGISVWNQSRGDFEFKSGPVFANIVIGDEINRASPKTQSALLEVMEERQVTVDGDPRQVPRPFVVIATQNPIEMEGTYSLPEAQLDRFLLKMTMGYPDLAAEASIVTSRSGGQPPVLSAVLGIDEVTRMVSLGENVRLDPQLVQYVANLVHTTRQNSDLRLGSSPRGTLGLLRASQVLALAEGRSFAVAEDVKRMAVPVLAHRLLVAPDAQLRGVTAEQIVNDLLRQVSVPGGVGA